MGRNLQQYTPNPQERKPQGFKFLLLFARMETRERPPMISLAGHLDQRRSLRRNPLARKESLLCSTVPRQQAYPQTPQRNRWKAPFQPEQQPALSALRPKQSVNTSGTVTSRPIESAPGTTESPERRWIGSWLRPALFDPARITGEIRRPYYSHMAASIGSEESPDQCPTKYRGNQFMASRKSRRGMKLNNKS